MNGTEGLMTTTEAAQHLRVSVSYVKKLIHDDKLPSIKLGRCRRIEPAAVAGYIERRRRTAKATRRRR
jgi:excisionase family DNA binding protein